MRNREVRVSKRGTIVPSERMMLSISAFGGLSIAVLDPLSPGGARKTQIDSKGHSRKIWSLVEYLIFSGKDAAPFEELIELLWPDGGAEDPLATLRLLVHRARNELDGFGIFGGTQMIVRHDRAYSWNREVPMKTDVEMFDQLYNKSRHGGAAARLEALMEATDLYRGRFLEKSAQRQWVMVLDTYYHSKYIAICKEAINILTELDHPWDIIELCKRAVALDPYVEPLHEAFIKALIDVGSFNAAMEHYKRVTAMFMDEFGITPSEGLKSIYRTLVRTTNTLEADIRVIRRALIDTNDDGAVFLEFEMFKQVCQLKSRESMRNGQKMQLALISASPAAGKTPGQRSRRTCMERLSVVIQNSLRQNDLYTRYSVLQYLVLLQSADDKSGRKILDRIQRGFQAAYPRSGYLLQCSQLPLLPREAQKGAISTKTDNDS